jgi:hypothetical protein
MMKQKGDCKSFRDWITNPALSDITDHQGMHPDARPLVAVPGLRNDIVNFPFHCSIIIICSQG